MLGVIVNFSSLGLFGCEKVTPDGGVKAWTLHPTGSVMIIFVPWGEGPTGLQMWTFTVILTWSFQRSITAGKGPPEGVVKVAEVISATGELQPAIA